MGVLEVANVCAAVRERCSRTSAGGGADGVLPLEFGLQEQPPLAGAPLGSRGCSLPGVSCAEAGLAADGPEAGSRGGCKGSGSGTGEGESTAGGGSEGGAAPSLPAVGQGRRWGPMAWWAGRGPGVAGRGRLGFCGSNSRGRGGRGAGGPLHSHACLAMEAADAQSAGAAADAAAAAAPQGTAAGVQSAEAEHESASAGGMGRSASRAGQAAEARALVAAGKRQGPSQGGSGAGGGGAGAEGGGPDGGPGESRVRGEGGDGGFRLASSGKGSCQACSDKEAGIHPDAGAGGGLGRPGASTGHSRGGAPCEGGCGGPPLEVVGKQDAQGEQERVDEAVRSLSRLVEQVARVLNLPLLGSQIKVGARGLPLLPLKGRLRPPCMCAMCAHERSQPRAPLMGAHR